MNQMMLAPTLDFYSSHPQWFITEFTNMYEDVSKHLRGRWDYGVYSFDENNQIIIDHFHRYCSIELFNRDDYIYEISSEELAGFYDICSDSDLIMQWEHDQEMMLNHFRMSHVDENERLRFIPIKEVW